MICKENVNGVMKGVYAVKVRTAGESLIAETLRNRGFDVMMPMIEIRRQYSDRCKRSQRALFPGYVFVKLTRGDLLPLVSTRGVSYLVKTGRDLEPLPEEDLIKIRVLCSEAVERQPYKFLTRGQQVLIETGPLRGLCGVLVDSGSGNARVVLSVNSIFQSVSVDARDTKLKVLSQ